MVGALDGIRILDFSNYLAGPYSSMILGDLGAEIIKIEEPSKGDGSREWGPPFINGESSYFMSVNRNKKSVTLNLKSQDGIDIVRRLARSADIVLENFRPGTVARLGIDYDRLSKLNPKLIYCSISGFGQDGPYREMASYDIIAQAMGGMMGITGEVDGGPIKVGVAIADICAGMFSTIAILAALNARTKTGTGQFIDVSLLDGQLSWLTYQAGAYFASGKNPKRLGTEHPSIVPYQAFKAGDDTNFVVAVGNDSQWQRFCEALGLEELAKDAKYATAPDRVKNRLELVSLLSNHFMNGPAGEWLEKLEKVGVPSGPIYNLDQIFRDPQVLHREMVQKIEHPKAGSINVVAPPFKMSQTSPSIRSHPPVLGGNTHEVLLTLGFTDQEIRIFEENGVV